MLAARTTAEMAAMASRWSRVGIIKGPDAMRPTIPRHRHTGTTLAATLTEEAAAEGATLRLLREVTAETEIKKSRFVATAAPVASPKEAMDFVKAKGDPSASHNCFAYVIGAEYRFSDDGEPGGTAGRVHRGTRGLRGGAKREGRRCGGRWRE